MTNTTKAPEGICESCDDLAALSTYTDEQGREWHLCPACIPTTTPTEGEDTMSTTTTTTTKRTRSTALAVGPAKGKRVVKTRTYTVAEVADLTGVTHYAVRRWLTMGYLPATTAPVEGSKRSAALVSGEALAQFFAGRKQAAKEVAARRVEREAKAAARAKTDEPTA